MNNGWSGTIQQFLQLNLGDFINKIELFVYGDSTVETATEHQKRASQIKAWKDSFHKLQMIFQQYDTLDGSLIFEYEILRGGGRRPDVILILNGYVVVIECKSYNRLSPSEYIQTSLYVRDLEHYHSEIHSTNTTVVGTLLLTNHHDGRLILNPDHQIYVSTVNSFHKLINGIINKPSRSFDLSQLINGVYEPSPSMLEAARSILNNEPLPNIKAVASSNFEEVQHTVLQIIQQAQLTKTHHLILVSGEPGAGKTYLGLNIAHNTNNAVYLSGNGPLVDVLQDTLKNRTFVQGLYGYKMDYLERGIIPIEQVIILDEAQRAWDSGKVDQSLKRRNRPLMHLSEPDIIMQIATSNKPWSVTIGLIGEGQEIYSGEEGGLKLWNTAIAGKNIIVHSKHHSSLFTNARQYNTHNHLHLNCSFRAHAALEYYAIVNSLLDEQFDLTKELVGKLSKDRYSLFITRDLNRARSVVSKLYIDDFKTTGVICASGADGQKKVPVIPRDALYEKPSKVAQYFNYPDSKFYCKKLNYSTTEFHTQGLELDMTIVHWDNDLYLKDWKWNAEHLQRSVEDPFQIKLNSYRVILTRGRDGTIIYIPPKTCLDETWRILTEYIGIPVL
ncbi:DNA/RNA helicase domain-containing protein [Niallia sp. XMNu-256]|uniref:DNA/RNA helicase domain-containing protein n=1 Tax=Niallia sp. XMNu-256 TaxID=3082444 RepID=UPI0030CE4459